jgi:hypothetical protein
LDGLNPEFYQTFKEHQGFSKYSIKYKGKECHQTHSTKPTLIWYQNQLKAQQKKYRPISLLKIDPKFLNKILETEFNTTLKISYTAPSFAHRK